MKKYQDNSGGRSNKRIEETSFQREPAAAEQQRETGSGGTDMMARGGRKKHVHDKNERVKDGWDEKKGRG